jgi:hypothetical protein
MAVSDRQSQRADAAEDARHAAESKLAAAEALLKRVRKNHTGAKVWEDIDAHLAGAAAPERDAECPACGYCGKTWEHRCPARFKQKLSQTAELSVTVLASSAPARSEAEALTDACRALKPAPKEGDTVDVGAAFRAVMPQARDEAEQRVLDACAAATFHKWEGRDAIGADSLDEIMRAELARRERVR